MYDLRLTGGFVVDGTGAPGTHADVGIRDGRVVAVGSTDEPARRTIDATGLVVAPGFIDVHTHYDAQVFWDPTLSPSLLHGVTTAIAGNCGFTIAPLGTDEDNEYLLRLLARVEGMPIEALRTGVPWNWRTTGEFFDAIDGNVAMNIGFSVGHSTIRRIVMGDESTGRTATTDEVQKMAMLLREGLEAGALGFSSSWGEAHNDDDGVPVPSRAADAAELVTLSSVCRDYEGTSLEFIPTAGPFTPEVVEVMSAMSSAAQRPLNWNLLVVDAQSSAAAQDRLAASDHARSAGGKVVALAMPMTPLLRYTFRTGWILDTLPGWSEAMALPHQQRLQLLGDPGARRRLAAEASLPSQKRHHADWGARVIEQTFDPSLAHYQGRTVADIAVAEGKYPFDALLDIVCADELRTVFTQLPAKETSADWAARLAVWNDPRAVLGASDAGAHLDFLSTFNYTTWLLGTAVRQEQVLSLERAVQLLTDAPARLYGLRDRGRIEAGAYADLVVFDPQTVGSAPVRSQPDLPGGGIRLYAEATGIEHVLVNGIEVLRAGNPREERPGSVLRAGRDTHDPSLL